MSLAILLALGAGLLFGVLSLAYKYAERVSARSAQFTFVMSATGAVITFLKSFNEVSTWNDPKLWIFGGVLGVVIVLGVYIIMAANRLGPVYMSWTMVNVSFLFAIFLSAVVLKEKLLCVDPINLALFGITLFFFVRGMRAGIGRQHSGQTLFHLVALVGIFIVNGFASFGSKIKYTLFEDANTSAYATVFYLVSAAITFVLMVASRERKLITRHEIQSGILGGACMSIATIMFLSAMSLPAAAVFTITQGVSLTSGVALTTLVGKERLNRWMIVGLVLGLCLLFAVIFREQTAAFLCGK